MRRYVVTLAGVACALLAGSLPAVAAEPFSDTLCPRSVPKVIEYNEVSGGNNADKIVAAAHGAAEAYALCGSDAQGSGVAIEPLVNYDKTRSAQFLVVAGRVESLLGDAKQAMADLRKARSLATEVSEWQPQAMSYQMSSGAAGNSSSRNNDRNGSRYKAVALEIVTAADAELAKLRPASPQPAASPKP